MAYEARIVLDGANPNGVRLTTFEVTFPRIVLAEFNTHRLFSRNSASSRAIPVQKMIERAVEDPFIPIWWGKNQSGMQAAEELAPIDQDCARTMWLVARDEAVHRVGQLSQLGLHKQIANRLLEPFLWHTVIVTATDYGNFFAQRCHPAAQPEIRRVAEMMRDLYFGSAPTERSFGDWHLPLVDGVDLDELRSRYNEKQIAEIAVARCARVSYLTHNGERDPEEDRALFERLLTSGHWSPFEHAAWAVEHFDSDKCGNFGRGWLQYRKCFKGEMRTYPEAANAC